MENPDMNARRRAYREAGAQMTPEALDTILGALPGEMDQAEVCALFSSILDAYHMSAEDGFAIGVTLGLHYGGCPGDHDKGDGPTDQQRVEAALKMLPEDASGHVIVNILCGVMECYELPSDLGRMVAERAGRNYQKVMSVIQTAEGSEEDRESAAKKLLDRLMAQNPVGSA